MLSHTIIENSSIDELFWISRGVHKGDGGWRAELKALFAWFHAIPPCACIFTHFNLYRLCECCNMYTFMQMHMHNYYTRSSFYTKCSAWTFGHAQMYIVEVPCAAVVATKIEPAPCQPYVGNRVLRKRHRALGDRARGFCVDGNEWHPACCDIVDANSWWGAEWNCNVIAHRLQPTHNK